MRIINFRRNEFHLAETKGELKKAVQAMYYWDHLMQTHHVFGRYGIMRMLVENNLPVSAWIHGLQKSTSLDDRKTFDLYVRNLIGEKRWSALEELQNYIKHQNPLFRG